MLKIREMKVEDIAGVYSVECMAFANPWSIESFEDELKNSNAIYMVGIIEKEVVAYCGLWKILDEGHITNIAVSPSYRRKGIGKKLVNTIIVLGETRGINRFTLEVRESNVNAIKLYRGLGFENLGIRKNYYTNPKENAIIMWKE